MSEHRKALERIIEECCKASSYTRRIQHINNIAMQALGMTFNQRQEVHQKAESDALKTKLDLENRGLRSVNQRRSK